MMPERWTTGAFRPQVLSCFRFRLGSWIAARKPADRKSWTPPRRFGPINARPDADFFVPTHDSAGR